MLQTAFLQLASSFIEKFCEQARIEPFRPTLVIAKLKVPFILGASFFVQCPILEIGQFLQMVMLFSRGQQRTFSPVKSDETDLLRKSHVGFEEIFCTNHSERGQAVVDQRQISDDFSVSFRSQWRKQRQQRERATVRVS